MSKTNTVAYKPGKKGWIKSDFGGGLCFTLTYDKLQEMLLANGKFNEGEVIERVEINAGGITIYIDDRARTIAYPTPKKKRKK